MARVVSQAVAAMDLTARGKGVRVQQVMAPQLPDALIDERRIAQVLVNLLSNALKFTPDGGKITVRVGDDPQRPAEIRVSVSDTGRGSRRRNWARFSISSIRFAGTTRRFRAG